MRTTHRRGLHSLLLLLLCGSTFCIFCASSWSISSSINGFEAANRPSDIEWWLVRRTDASIAPVWSDNRSLVQHAYVRMIPHDYDLLGPPGQQHQLYYVNAFAESNQFNELSLYVLDGYIDFGTAPIAAGRCLEELSARGWADFRRKRVSKSFYYYPSLTLPRFMAVERLQRQLTAHRWVAHWSRHERALVGRAAVLCNDTQIVGCGTLLPLSVAAHWNGGRRDVWRVQLAPDTAQTQPVSGSILFARMYSKGGTRTRMLVDLRTAFDSKKCVWWILRNDCSQHTSNNNSAALNWSNRAQIVVRPNGAGASPTSLDLDWSFYAEQHRFFVFVVRQCGERIITTRSNASSRSSTNSAAAQDESTAVHCARVEKWNN